MSTKGSKCNPLLPTHGFKIIELFYSTRVAFIVFLQSVPVKITSMAGLAESNYPTGMLKFTFKPRFLLLQANTFSPILVELLQNQLPFHYYSSVNKFKT